MNERTGSVSAGVPWSGQPVKWNWFTVRSLQIHFFFFSFRCFTFITRSVKLARTSSYVRVAMSIFNLM